MLLVALGAAACGAAPDDSPSSTAGSTATPGGTAIATDPPGGTTDPGPTELPPTEQPTVTPTDPAPTDEPSPTAGTGPAAACAGNDENRDFYAAVAESVAWTVFCPVLDGSWFVDSGQYRLAGGGWMEIAYRGPGGARIELREGAACTTEGCVPSGDDAGEHPFGTLTGTLLELGDGEWAVVVDSGASPSWTIVGIGLERSAFEGIAAGLTLVEG